jgi:hypothetical protein
MSESHEQEHVTGYPNVRIETRSEQSMGHLPHSIIHWAHTSAAQHWAALLLTSRNFIVWLLVMRSWVKENVTWIKESWQFILITTNGIAFTGRLLSRGHAPTSLSLQHAFNCLLRIISDLSACSNITGAIKITQNVVSSQWRFPRYGG